MADSGKPHTFVTPPPRCVALQSLILRGFAGDPRGGLAHGMLLD